MHGPLVDADGLYSDYAEIFSDRQNIVGAEAEKLSPITSSDDNEYLRNERCRGEKR